MAAGGEPEMVMDYMTAKTITTEVLHNTDGLKDVINGICMETIYFTYLNIYTSPIIFDFFTTEENKLKLIGIIKFLNLKNKKKITDGEANTQIENYIRAFRNIEAIYQRINHMEFDTITMVKRWTPEYNEHLDIIKGFYDNFFSLYLKGGKAMRYLVEYINSLINEAENRIDISILGKNSDFDFNFIINPYLESYFYEGLSDIVLLIIQKSFEANAQLPFFDTTTDFSRYILTELHRTLNDIEFDKKREKISSVQTTLDIGGKTLSFILVRLLVQFYSRSIGNVKGELIDISIIRKNVERVPNNEAYIDWEYSKNLIDIKNREILGLKEDLMRGFNPLQIYALSTILEDLELTIKEGDVSKIEKRKKRLNFFEEILCYNNIAQKVSGLDEETFKTYTQERCKQLLDIFCNGLFSENQLKWIRAITSGKEINNSLDIFFYIFKYEFNKKDTYNFIYRDELGNINDITKIIPIFNNELKERLFEQIDGLKEWIIENTPEEREIIIVLFCYLTNDFINLYFSFNDQFMYISIFYHFLDFLGTIRELIQRNREDLIYRREEFIQELINDLDMRIEYDYYLRNKEYSVSFIQTFSKFIIQNLFKKLETILPNNNFLLNIRGGLAFNFQLLKREIKPKTESKTIFRQFLFDDYRPIENLETNDIDFELYTDSLPEPILNELKTQIKIWLVEICNEISKIISEEKLRGRINYLKLEPVILENIVYQIVSIIEDKFRPPYLWEDKPISNSYVQHPFELRIYNVNSDYFNNIINKTTLINYITAGRPNHLLGMTNPLELVHAFDQVLKEDKHPIRKEKYLYRILFLTNNNYSLDNYNSFLNILYKSKDEPKILDDAVALYREHIRRPLVEEEPEPELPTVGVLFDEPRPPVGASEAKDDDEL